MGGIFSEGSFTPDPPTNSVTQLSPAYETYQGASAIALALVPVSEPRPHEQPVLPNAFTGEHLEPRAPSTSLAARPVPFVPCRAHTGRLFTARGQQPCHGIG
jgi:hypothetical protein